MTPNPRPSELSRDVAHAMNLFAHPLAGWAAASAVSMGLATQMWGVWAGAMAGAMENAARARGAAAPESRSQTVAAVKARAAAVSLMAEAQSFAREMADEPAPPVRARNVVPQKRKPAPKAESVPTEVSRATGRPAELSKPRKPDDLKRIAGVGPKLEQVLNGLGIWTFAQVADWNEADAAWVEEQLGLSGRIGRDGWVAEAKKLARSRRK